MNTWQPMETAPKDGTEVILRLATRHGPSRPVEILNGWFDGTWRGVCSTRRNYLYFDYRDITHWMPIPELPEETK